MKNMRMYLLVFAFMTALDSVNAQTFWQDDFENATTPDITNGSTRTASNNGGSGGPPNTSYFKRTNGSDISVATASFSSVSNTFFWAGEDHDTPFGASAAEQQIEWTGINISGKSSITFSGLFGANSTNGSWDNFTTGSGASGYGIFAYPSASNDYIMVEYAVDAGAYIKLISFFGDDITGPIGSAKKLKEDTDGNFIGDGTALNQAMAEFTKSITVSGSIMKIRIRVYSNGGNEEWAIDNFRLSSPITSSTWNGTTWSNGLPTASIDAIIASSTTPTSFTCKNLTINSSVSLSTTGITATVNGNIINNGNGISGTGGLTVASNSTISGTAISFNGTLTVNSGAVLTTGGLLTLTSNASNTARVASGSSSGGYISGLVKVERYIPGSYRKFRFLGHPFATAMNVTELTDDIDITGSITGSNANGFTATTTNNPSAFTFTEANGDNAAYDAGWTAITSGNSVSTIAQGQGIRILVRGTKGQTGSLTGGVYTPNAVTLSLNGTLKQGDFTQNLNYTSAIKGWNLVSNPYASNINWSTVTRTNVNNAVYVYRPSTNAYASWINGSSTNGGSNIIEAGNAFFVQANAASPSLGWHETDKVATAQPATMFRETSVITNRLSLSLVQEATQTTDEVVVRFGDDAATDLFDSKYDAKNIVASSHDLYVLDNQATQYSIYHGSALKNEAIENREVALGFTVGTLGTYSLKAKVLNAITGGNKAFIKDAFAHTLTELTDNTSYTFEVTADTKKQEEGRFSIVFNVKAKTKPTISDFSIKLSPNPAKDVVTVSYINSQRTSSQIRVLNAEGKVEQMISIGDNFQGVIGINLSELSAGIYIVEYTSGKEKIAKQVVKK